MLDEEERAKQEKGINMNTDILFSTFSKCSWKRLLLASSSARYRRLSIHFVRRYMLLVLSPSEVQTTEEATEIRYRKEETYIHPW